MKSSWLGVGIATLLLATAPALAQDERVKAGVDSWQRGDYAKAVETWRGPAIAGDPDAQFNLGQAYKLGRGVDQRDLAQAEEWYRRAAVQGHPQAEDNYGLALFQNGKRTQAVEWLQKSATRGEPRAQFVLGTMYFNGDAVKKDWVRAYALITRASASGLPQASSTMAEMDRYISLADRQQGLELARRYEEEAGRTQLADLGPAPSTKPSRPGSVARVDLPPSQPSSGYRPVDAAPLEPRPIPPATRPAPPVAKPPVARPPVATPVAADGGWRVQLGAFGDPNNARKLWGQVGSRFPGRQVYYVKAGALTKVLVGPYGSRGEAAGACGSVKPCVPVAK